jgi:hypothetical protein
MFIFSLKTSVIYFFADFVKWMFPFCPNIDTLKIDLIDQPNDLHIEIVRLKKLKDLFIGTTLGIDPKEVTCVAFRIKTTLLTSS